MHVDEAAVARLEARYGRPGLLAVEQPIDDAELALVRTSTARGRRHDLTLFIFEPSGRIALIRKHTHPPGVFRAPSGGAAPDEPP
ncbi:MAG TPA: NUDIX hydrolase, partial [Bacillota bacterium]